MDTYIVRQEHLPDSGAGGNGMSGAVMRASYRERYCALSDLRISNIDIPVAAQGEMLVRIRRTAISRTDGAIVTGTPAPIRLFSGLFKPELPVTGTDFAGEVVALGEGVTSYRIGDRVYGFRDDGAGTHAEYAAIPERVAVARIPEGVSYEQAVASLEGGHYAAVALRGVDLSDGDEVVVNGGTGAIGSILIQLLAARGCRVVATCRAEHVKIVGALGASEVIDYETSDFTQVLEGREFAAVLDAVGKSEFGKCKSLIREGGFYSSTELGPRCENPFLAITTRFGAKRKVRFLFPNDIEASIAMLRPLLEAGALKPLIDRVYRPDQIVEAFEYVESGQKVGNVLMDWDERSI